MRLGAQDLGRAVRFWVEVVGAKLVSFDEERRATIDVGAHFLFDVVQDAPASTVPFYIYARGSLDVARDVLANRGVQFEAVTCEDDAEAVLARDPEGNAFIIRAAS